MLTLCGRRRTDGLFCKARNSQKAWKPVGQAMPTFLHTLHAQKLLAKHLQAMINEASSMSCGLTNKDTNRFFNLALLLQRPAALPFSQLWHCKVQIIASVRKATAEHICFSHTFKMQLVSIVHFHQRINTFVLFLSICAFSSPFTGKGVDVCIANDLADSSRWPSNPLPDEPLLNPGCLMCSDAWSCFNALRWTEVLWVGVCGSVWGLADLGFEQVCDFACFGVRLGFSLSIWTCWLWQSLFSFLAGRTEDLLLPETKEGSLCPDDAGTGSSSDVWATCTLLLLGHEILKLSFLWFSLPRMSSHLCWKVGSSRTLSMWCVDSRLALLW